MTMLAPPPTVAQPSPPTAVPPDEPDVAVGALLRGISWGTYERLRDETNAAGEHVRLTYLDGTLHLMPPLPDHETWKTLLGSMIRLLVIELDIPMRSLGSTTWRREGRQGGLEADECYYIQNEAAVRGKRRFDLTVDPPPDLAFESELTHAPVNRLAVYARLRVPEVWRYDGSRLTALVLTEADGEPAYLPVEASRAFPFLTPSSLEPFLSRVFDGDETALLKEFRTWVNTTLKPKA